MFYVKFLFFIFYYYLEDGHALDYNIYFLKNLFELIYFIR